jgi:succinate dehydrogenase subunit C
MSRPLSYVRSMKGWWYKHPVYLKYMARESTSIFVTIYALVLLSGLWRLDQGEDAWVNWLAGLSSPVSMLFHVTAFVAAGYHTVTWFRVAPKVMPHIYFGTSRITDETITRLQYVIASVSYAALFILVWGV